MKKSIIVIALALLMVGSLFAEVKDTLPATVSTTVELNLQLDDKYSFGVTKAVVDADYVTKLAEGAKSAIASTDIVDTIDLSYDKTTYEIEETTTDADGNTLYVSYLFTEYSKCKLSMYINQPLTSTKVNSTTSKVDTINYTASFRAAGSTGDYTAVSSSTAKDASSAIEVTTISTAATKIGEHVQGSYELKITGNETLENKVADKYTSAIVLYLATVV